MSEMGEMYGELAKLKSEKKASNRNESATILTNRGINYLIRNGGAHLIVQHDNREWDFWPGTGKWKERGTDTYHRGVFNLLKEVLK